MFTATFIGIGLAFLFFPEPTKAGMFGAMPALGPEDQLLWQILGSTIATVVGPICYTQQVPFAPAVCNSRYDKMHLRNHPA